LIILPFSHVEHNADLNYKPKDEPKATLFGENFTTKDELMNIEQLDIFTRIRGTFFLIKCALEKIPKLRSYMSKI
jgi:hypothetical protein